MRAAESAAALTRQLLAFSRRQVTEPRPIDLNSHIEGIVPLLSRLIGENIRLAMKLGPGAASIMADPGQVEQIVINLVANARDSMPGGGHVVIETRKQHVEDPPATANPIMKPGDYVRLSVTDCGTGIPAEDLQHIFDPFFTTKPIGKGTGLGLALVYGAVQQNGGSIVVNSARGTGTTMAVYFPAAGNHSRARAPEHEPAELPRGREAVLLVEDDAAVLDFIKLILASLGYRVYAAADGAAALAVSDAHETGIDLLLTDFILPDMTGTTLAAQVRALRSGLKVLFMSGHAENIAMGEGADDDGGHCIAKPFTAEELAQKVREVLDGGGDSESGNKGSVTGNH
jgi:CheY-like chemotaxis protein